MNLRFHKEVQGDLSIASDWYERRSEGLGRRLLMSVYQLATYIADKPHIYQVAYKDYRRAIVRPFPYLMYYCIRIDIVIVVGVFHAARNPRDVLDSLDHRESPEQPADS